MEEVALLNMCINELLMTVLCTKLFPTAFKQCRIQLEQSFIQRGGHSGIPLLPPRITKSNILNISYHDSRCILHVHVHVHHWDFLIHVNHQLKAF